MDAVAESKSVKYGRILLVAGCVSLITFGAAYGATREAKQDEPRNVIFMVPDGTGHTTLTMARDALRALNGDGSMLNLDDMLIGSAITYATDALVTDSAASATAYACGHKTYNGALGVDPDVLPIASLFEGAKRAGMLTGAVVTTEVTHATPAAFTAHVQDRSQNVDIAEQQVRHSNVDFLIGGGRRHFSEALLDEARDKGYTVGTSRADYNEWKTTNVPFPFIGLVANQDINYEIDRQDEVEPGLFEMVTDTLRHLRPYAEEGGSGFMVMFEGSRVDHAGHANDPAAHLREAMDYDRTIGEVKKFAQEFPNTLLISVADHETGGLSLARDSIYDWYPEILLQVQMSSIRLVEELLTLAPALDPVEMKAMVQTQAVVLMSDTQTDDLRNLLLAGENRAAENMISLMVSDEVRVKWATDGHSAADVGVYAMGPAQQVDELTNAHLNIHMNTVVEKYLGFDLDAITAELREPDSPYIPVPGPAPRRTQNLKKRFGMHD